MYNNIKSILQKRDVLIANLIIGFYAISLFIFSQSKALSNVYWIDDDWPQHLLWLYKFHPNYFQDNDFYMMAAEAIQPWGVYIVNSILGTFFSPLFISKFFPLVTLWAVCWFSFFLMKKRFGWALAISAMVMMSNIPLERMVGFFARAYAFPLLLAFTYFWIEEKKRSILFVIFLSAVFYPVIFLIECFIISIDGIITLLKGKLRDNLKYYASLGVVILFSCGVLLLKSKTINSNEFLGGFLSKEELLNRPEFGSGGRVDFQYNMNTNLPLEFPWKFYLRFPFSDYHLETVSLLLAILTIILLLGRSSHPKLDTYILSLLITGTILFYLAQWRLPQLFLPERYIYYSYLPFMFLLVLRNASFLQSYLNGSKLAKGLIAATLIFATFHIKSPKNIGLYGYDNHRGLYEKINTFKEPVLIAGPPAITSQIPTFCRQSVLFSDEAVHGIYFTNYYDYVKPRVDAFVNAYSSREKEDLVSFIKQYKIDYLILDKGFTSSKNMWFYQPYAKILKQRTKDIGGSELALSQISEEFIIEADWQYDLLDCNKWIFSIDSLSNSVSPSLH